MKTLLVNKNFPNIVMRSDLADDIKQAIMARVVVATPMPMAPLSYTAEAEQRQAKPYGKQARRNARR